MTFAHNTTTNTHSHDNKINKEYLTSLFENNENFDEIDKKVLLEILETADGNGIINTNLLNAAQRLYLKSAMCTNTLPDQIDLTELITKILWGKNAPDHPRVFSVKEDFSSSPIGLGKIGELGQGLGKNGAEFDLSVLEASIKRNIELDRQYDVIPVITLLFNNKLTKEQLTKLSLQLRDEYNYNYSDKSIRNAVNSILRNDDIIVAIKEKGVEYYMLDRDIKLKILEDYYEISNTTSNVNNDSDMEEKIVQFLLLYYKERIIDLLTIDASRLLVIVYEDVLSFDDELASFVKERTKEALWKFNKAVRDVIKQLYVEEHGMTDGEADEKSQSIDIKVTFTSDITHKRLLDIDISRDLNKLITVEATIVSSTKPFAFFKRITYVCRECGHEMTLLQDFLKPREVVTVCEACGSRNIVIDEHNSEVESLTVFSVQDLLENLKSNEQPQEFPAYTTLFSDKPIKLVGQRVKLSAIVRSRIHLENKKATASDIVLEVIYIEEIDKRNQLILTEEDIQKIKEFRKQYKEDEILDLLVGSVAPQIYSDKEKTRELWAFKEAVLVSLVSEKRLVNNQRKWINVLIIGDKGTGKSQILEDVRKLLNLEIVTGGGSISKGGLIGIAEKDDITSKWVFRAGALARANNSTLLVDEFDKMSDEEYKTLHTVMSMGYYVFNKADLNLHVSSRESIITVANPLKSEIDNTESIFEQINFSKSLLDRFDIIIALRSNNDEELLEEVMEHILESMNNEVRRIVDDELFVKYILYVSSINIEKWEDDAVKRLKDFIKQVSKYLQESTFNYSYRIFVSLYNMSECISKLKMKNTVTVEDVNEGIRLFTTAIMSWGEDIDFSVLNELVHEMSSEERELLEKFSEVFNKLSEDYSQIVPLKEMFKKLSEVLVDEEKVHKAISLALEKRIVHKEKIDNLIYLIQT